jgi:hypothetical protein
MYLWLPSKVVVANEALLLKTKVIGSSGREKKLYSPATQIVKGHLCWQKKSIPFFQKMP